MLILWKFYWMRYSPRSHTSCFALFYFTSVFPRWRGNFVSVNPNAENCCGWNSQSLEWNSNGEENSPSDFVMLLYVGCLNKKTPRSLTHTIFRVGDSGLQESCLCLSSFVPWFYCLARCVLPTAYFHVAHISYRTLEFLPYNGFDKSKSFHFIRFAN